MNTVTSPVQQAIDTCREARILVGQLTDKISRGDHLRNILNAAHAIYDPLERIDKVLRHRADQQPCVSGLVSKEEVEAVNQTKPLWFAEGLKQKAPPAAEDAPGSVEDLRMALRLKDDRIKAQDAKIADLTSQIDKLKADREQLSWNLAGCSSVATGACKPYDYHENHLPVLDDVSELRRDFDAVKEARRTQDLLNHDMRIRIQDLEQIIQRRDDTVNILRADLDRLTHTYKGSEACVKAQKAILDDIKDIAEGNLELPADPESKTNAALRAVCIQARQLHRLRQDNATLQKTIAQSMQENSKLRFSDDIVETTPPTTHGAIHLIEGAREILSGLLKDVPVNRTEAQQTQIQVMDTLTVCAFDLRQAAINTTPPTKLRFETKTSFEQQLIDEELPNLKCQAPVHSQKDFEGLDKPAPSLDQKFDNTVSYLGTELACVTRRLDVLEKSVGNIETTLRVAQMLEANATRAGLTSDNGQSVS